MVGGLINMTTPRDDQQEDPALLTDQDIASQAADHAITVDQRPETPAPPEHRQGPDMKAHKGGAARRKAAGRRSRAQAGQSGQDQEDQDDEDSQDAEGLLFDVEDGEDQENGDLDGGGGDQVAGGDRQDGKQENRPDRQQKEEKPRPTVEVEADLGGMNLDGLDMSEDFRGSAGGGLLGWQPEMMSGEPEPDAEYSIQIANPDLEPVKESARRLGRRSGEVRRHRRRSVRRPTLQPQRVSQERRGEQLPAWFRPPELPGQRRPRRR